MGLCTFSREGMAPVSRVMIGASSTGGIKWLSSFFLASVAEPLESPTNTCDASGAISKQKHQNQKPALEVIAKCWADFRFTSNL